MNQLTYRQAATRVHRSIRTIKRWRKHGMPMGFDDRGRRVVLEHELLKHWRGRMQADPVHQQRIRAAALAALSVGGQSSTNDVSALDSVDSPVKAI